MRAPVPKIAFPLLPLALGLGLGAPAADADRLVTRDGAVIETRGPWRVEGRLVIFRLPDGTLSSIRLVDADLEGSAELAGAEERQARRLAATEATRAEVLATVESWADAWSRQRVDRYLSHYAADFLPASGLDLPRWRDQRRARVGGPAFIELEIGAVDIVELGPGRVRASFTQSFRSDRYEDVVLKTLELGRRNGAWRILREEAGPLDEARSPFVLTDKDVAHVAPDAEEASGAESSQEEAPSQDEASGGGVRIVSWSDELDAEASERTIQGSLRNMGSTRGTGLEVRALFYNQSGVLIAAHDVPLTSRILSSGETLEFALPVSEALAYERVSFQIRGRGFRTRVQRFAAPGDDSPDE